VYALPLSVAVAQILSKNSILTHVVYVAQFVIHENIGISLSIQSTIPVASPVLPARSAKVNVKRIPFPVNVYHVALVHVIFSLNPVSIHSTSPLVRLHEAGMYSTRAVGGVISGIFIMKLAHVKFPTASRSSKIYDHHHVIASPLVYEIVLSLAVAHGLLSEKNIFTAPVYIVQLSTHENVGNSISSIASPVSGHESNNNHESITLPEYVNNQPVNDVASKVNVYPVSHHNILVYPEIIFVHDESISSIAAISPTSSVPLNCKLTA